MFDAHLEACKDPTVQSVRAQAFALHLLTRGLRPKQVAIAAGITHWKAKQLRRGLFPDDLSGGTPMSAATILRRPFGRIAASLFIDVYRRLTTDHGEDEVDWNLFLRAFDIYTTIACRGEALVPLTIADACTVLIAFKSGVVEQKACHVHRTRHLVIPKSERPWGCPYCTFEAGEWSVLDVDEADDCAGEGEQILTRAGAEDLAFPFTLSQSA